nr:ComF family protein [Vibrio variabilis]
MDNTAEICGACLTTPLPWQTLTCLGDYRPPLSSFIQRIKQHKEPWLLPPLSKLLAKRISEPAPLLICVPTQLHVELKRGFNLSELIMLQLAQHLPEVKTADSIFRKHRQTATQKSLNRQQRMENVRQAFSLQQRPTSKHVAIIDDVVTTGATVRHLSELLLEVNVEKIDIYCLCRTPK